MKTEKLTIEHLAPYLRYGLKWKSTKYKEISTMIGLIPSQAVFKISDDEIESYTNFTLTGDTYIKPILRPLSDLLSSGCFVDIETASENEMNQHMWEDLRCRLERCEKSNSNTDINKMPYWVVELLFKYHVDVFGLIDKGLAIDINTLEQ